MSISNVIHRYGLVLGFLFSASFTVAEEASKVRVTAIKNEKVRFKVRTYGVLSPRVEEMSFQIPGRIERFLVDEADRVTAGQVLVELETKNAESVLDKRKLDLANARRSLDRMTTLFKERSIPESQLDDAQARFDQIQIAYDQAQLNLSWCTLKAPSDGIILKQFIDSRTSVNPGQPIFVFRSDSEQWVTKVDLTDKNAFLMTKGAGAEVTFAPYPNILFEGEITKLAKVANPSDGLYTAEVTISTKGKELLLGMVAEVDLVKETEETFAVVPFEALLDLRKNQGTIYLSSKDQTTAVEKKVTINNIEGDQVSLVEDLSAYTMVITRGQSVLEDQTAIAIQE